MHSGSKLYRLVSLRLIPPPALPFQDRAQLALRLKTL
jgi:hypothetical protein